MILLYGYLLILNLYTNKANKSIVVICNPGLPIVGAAVQGVQSAAEQGLSAAMMKVQVCVGVCVNTIVPLGSIVKHWWISVYCIQSQMTTMYVACSGAVWSAADLLIRVRIRLPEGWRCVRKFTVQRGRCWLHGGSHRKCWWSRSPSEHSSTRNEPRQREANVIWGVQRSQQTVQRTDPILPPRCQV